jgi:hypothetical protein
MIWLGIGGFLLLIDKLEENPMLLTYIILGFLGISLLNLFLNFLHSVYLINFDSKFKSILKFNDKESKAHFENLLKKNRTEKIDIDEEYFRFISSSKIFECK